jgi:hypothetical protein
MKSQQSYVFYFEDKSLKKYKKNFAKLKESAHDVMDIICEEVATRIKAKDYLYNYYVEGGVYKALKKEGSAVHFVIDTQDQEDNLKSIITEEFIENIMRVLYDKPPVKDINEMVIPFPNFKDIIKIATHKELMEKKYSFEA